MRFTTIFACVFSYLLIGLFSYGANLEGQELKKFLRDYRDERVYNYSATDPNDRGKVFRTHTGHYGAFYNCDGEENKRNSPYICWKPHHERVFPPRLGFCENLRRDIAEITQRINDGSCGTCPSNCNCQQCQQAAPAPQPTCSCADCIARAAAQQNGLAREIPMTAQNQSVAETAVAIAPVQKQTCRTDNLMNKNYGLVSGKILQTEAASWQAAEENALATTAKPSNDSNSIAPAQPTPKTKPANSLLHALQQQQAVREAQKAKARSASKTDVWSALKRR